MLKNLRSIQLRELRVREGGQLGRPEVSARMWLRLRQEWLGPEGLRASVASPDTSFPSRCDEDPVASPGWQREFRRAE